jgi:hypothetical protein
MLKYLRYYGRNLGLAVMIFIGEKRKEKGGIKDVKKN